MVDQALKIGGGALWILFHSPIFDPFRFYSAAYRIRILKNGDSLSPGLLESVFIRQNDAFFEGRHKNGHFIFPAIL
jgi:hypothetical protein